MTGGTPILWLQRGHFCAVAGLDPNTKKSRWIQADTMDAPPSRKYAKAPESVAAQRFPALIISSHAGGHWFEASSLHQTAPDFLRNQVLFSFMPYRRRRISSRCVHHAKRMHAGALRRRKRRACDMSVFCCKMRKKDFHLFRSGGISWPYTPRS